VRAAACVVCVFMRVRPTWRDRVTTLQPRLSILIWVDNRGNDWRSGCRGRRLPAFSSYEKRCLLTFSYIYFNVYRQPGRRVDNNNIICFHYTNMVVFSYSATQPVTANGSVLGGESGRGFYFYFIFFIRTVFVRLVSPPG